MTIGALVVSLTAALVAVLAPAAFAAPTVNCNAGQDLQAKIDSVSGGTINVVGTCYGNYVINGKDLSLVGKPTATLDGMNSGPVVLVSTANNLHLTNLTVRNGSYIAGGGVLSNGSVVLSHDTLSNNTATVEAGAAVAEGTLNVSSSRILNNHVAEFGSHNGSDVFGGGGGLISGGTMTVTGSTVQGNTVAVYNNPGHPQALGGGVASDGAIHITNSRIVGNEVGTYGDGGVAFGSAVWSAHDKPVVVSKSVVSGNVASGTSTTSSTVSAGGTLVTGDVIGLSGLGGPLSLLNSTLSGNRAVADGGPSATGLALPGMAADYNSLTVKGSRILGNTGVAKGASGAAAEYLVAVAGDNMSITSSKITGNTGKANSPGVATGEGFILAPNSTSTLTMSKTTVDRNGFTVLSSGNMATGAIGVLGTTINVSNSTISRNFMNAGTSAASTATAEAPGLGGYQGTVKNSTMALNTAKATSPGSGGTSQALAGGLLFGTSNPSTVTESTIAGNALTAIGGTATSQGGGFYGDGHTTFMDSILALNKAVTGPDCYQMPTSGGFNLVGNTAGCGWSSSTGDKLNKNPKLLTLGNYGGPTMTMLPSASSPVVNAVPGGSCPIKSDQRGVKRPQGPKCDMGADERTSGDKTKAAATAAAPRTASHSAAGPAGRLTYSRLVAMARSILGSGTGALGLGGTSSTAHLLTASELRAVVALAVAAR